MYVLYNQEHFDILFDSCLKEGEYINLFTWMWNFIPL